MIVFAAFIVACVTGALFALAARTQGIDHSGTLFAIGVIGAGVQMFILIVWYLVDDRKRWRRFEPMPRSVEDVELRSPDRYSPLRPDGENSSAKKETEDAGVAVPAPFKWSE